MKGLIGKKLGMTQVFDENNRRVPVTVLEVGPCTVLSLRTAERDGYSAVQLGFGTRKPKNVPQAVRKHVAAAGLEQRPPAHINEFRCEDTSGYEVGTTLSADLFEQGEVVDVIGWTKGKGFQGVVRRWNFAGGRKTHGSDWLRKPGSVGMCEEPGRVYKGRKLPGRMPSARTTVQNLKVVDVRPEKNVVLVKGAVPGPNGRTVLVQSARKSQPV